MEEQRLNGGATLAGGATPEWRSNACRRSNA